MHFPFRQLLALALISWPAAGQNSPARQPPIAISNLRQLTRNSGYIFDGTVLSVIRSAENEIDNVPTVQITFRVEQAIRGTHRGQILTIREWAGLWTSGERYHLGERLLLFFYSPGKLGLTSPVGGRLGRFAVDSNGNLAPDSGLIHGASVDPASPADVRRTTLGTKPANRVSTRDLALAIQRADRE